MPENNSAVHRYEIHVESDLPDGMLVPDFGLLIIQMIDELKIKYRDYGNTWQEKDKAYWMGRLGNEHTEYCMAMGSVARKRKAINIANLALMAAETVRNDDD